MSKTSFQRLLIANTDQGLLVADMEKKKDRWDKVSSITPLLAAILVSAIGGAFTYFYNERQLQLNEITTLDKFRPELMSQNPQERKFGYMAFTKLGYEDFAIELIDAQKDTAAGYDILISLQIVGSSGITRKKAEVARQGLDAVRKLDSVERDTLQTPHSTH